MAANEQGAVRPAPMTSTLRRHDTSVVRVAAVLGIYPEDLPGARERALVLPPVPDPYDSENSLRRFLHDDLPMLSGEDLARERVVARMAWAQPGAHRWWTERVEAVEAEITRRRGGS